MASETRPGRLSGRAIAPRYAEEGASLFLTATSHAKLEETQALAEAKAAKVVLHTADVSERIGRHDRPVDPARRRHGGGLIDRSHAPRRRCWA